MPEAPLQTTVCVVGGGPAGVVLALLLARAGIDVTVLEKHKDFNRDFRGDTIHSATLRVMNELGLLEALLKIGTRRGGHRGSYLSYRRLHHATEANQLRRADAAVGFIGLSLLGNAQVRQRPNLDGAQSKCAPIRPERGGTNRWCAGRDSARA